MLKKLPIIPFVLMLSGWAQSAGRPPCNAQNRGEVWPKASEKGQAIEICTLQVWKYRWVAATVSVSQLAKESQRRNHHEVPVEIADPKNPRIDE